jgi:hypothetical protein
VAGETDGLTVLERQREAIERFRALTPAEAAHRYAQGKWSIKEVIGHLSDGERVVSYRLLRIARGDQTPLPGYDENLFAANSHADRRELADLVDEFTAVRASTIALVRSLDESALAARGTVNNWSLTVRGIVFIIVGHFQHHVNILRERYNVRV